jgi:hypothetical protein
MARSEQAQPEFSLDQYRKRFNIPPWGYNGVENPNENLRGCEHVWTQWQRDELAYALGDAEGLLAERLGFYLGERYLIDYDRVWADPLQLRYGHVLGAGVQGRAEVTPSASDFTTDPATITVPSASFSGGISEVVVIEDSTGLEIEYDEVATSGANYVISIGQYKLIEWDDLEDQSDPIAYNAAFPAATWLKLADLTVYRQYRDTDTQATITYGPSCNCWCAGEACVGTDYTGCAFVLNRDIGLVRVQRATLSAGTWSCDNSAVCGCCAGDKATVYYLAGTTDVPNWQRIVWRLAHSQMGEQPCGCALQERQWRLDRHEPRVLSVERLNCPWGLTQGAWAAWNWVTDQAHGKGFMLG